MDKNLKEALKEIGMENDTISLMVDVSSLEEVKYYYSVFGWKISSEKGMLSFIEHIILFLKEITLSTIRKNSNCLKWNLKAM